MMMNYKLVLEQTTDFSHDNKQQTSILNQTLETDKKHCNICGLDKSVEDFYKKPGGGYRSGCRKCLSKKASQILREKVKTKSDKENARKRSIETYYKRKAAGLSFKRSPEKEREYSNNYRTKYPEKAKAKDASKKFLPPIQGVERFFWSYRSEHHGDFFWVKREFRLKLNKLLSYEQKAMLFRRIDNKELLTTKQKFIDFMNETLKNQSDSKVISSIPLNQSLFNKN